MVHIVEDLLTSRRIQHCPIHVVPALFAAMGMHAIDICSGDVVREQLGNVKIRLAMIALRELKTTWPVSGWIFLLFTKIVRQIRDQGDLNIQKQQTSTSEGQSRSDKAKPRIPANTASYGIRGAEDQPVQSDVGLPQQQGALSSSSSVLVGWESPNIPMPFSFPADCDTRAYDSLWSGPELDFWMMPPGDGNTGDIY